MENSKPSKWTDDILGAIIIVSYIVQKKLGLVVPDWAFGLTLIWLYGRWAIDFLKLKSRGV